MRCNVINSCHGARNGLEAFNAFCFVKNIELQGYNKRVDIAVLRKQHGLTRVAKWPLDPLRSQNIVDNHAAVCTAGEICSVSMLQPKVAGE